MNTVAKNKGAKATPLISSFPADRPILRIIDRTEDMLLSLVLVSMILLSCTQIFLRTFLSSGLLWADPLLRYLVLWSGLLGAVAATGQGKHIALDIVGRKMPQKVAPWLTLLTHIFCCLASAGLTWAAVLFIQVEIEFASMGPLSLPLWFWNAIFPVAFGMIFLKYLFLSYLQLATIIQSNNVTGQEL